MSWKILVFVCEACEKRCELSSPEEYGTPNVCPFGREAKWKEKKYESHDYLG